MNLPNMQAAQDGRRVGGAYADHQKWAEDFRSVFKMSGY
jgi:hypothetical protein